MAKKMSRPREPEPAEPEPVSQRGPSWWPKTQPWVSLALRLLLGIVALWSGISKSMNFFDSVSAVRGYQLFPESINQAIGYSLPVLEIIVGALLVCGLLTRPAAVVWGLFMLAFIVGISQAWARGLSIDCGCFGGGGPVEPDQTQYVMELLRDTGLLIAAVALFIWPRSKYSADHALDIEL